MLVGGPVMSDKVRAAWCKMLADAAEELIKSGAVVKHETQNTWHLPDDAKCGLKFHDVPDRSFSVVYGSGEFSDDVKNTEHKTD